MLPILESANVKFCKPIRSVDCDRRRLDCPVVKIRPTRSRTVDLRRLPGGDAGGGRMDVIDVMGVVVSSSSASGTRQLLSLPVVVVDGGGPLDDVGR